MKAIDGFKGFHVVQVAANEVILLILGDTVEVLNRIATEVGSSWMSANVVPLLTTPPDRQIGAIVASIE
jgi:hypothetical protein